MTNALVRSLFEKISRGLFASSSIRLKGPYGSWGEAQLESEGYDSSEIRDAVISAALNAREQIGVFERDSVLVALEQRSWPLSASLLFAKSCSEPDKNFSVVDFGGSLGTTYYQNLDLLGTAGLKWTVVEQEELLEAGRRFFKDGQLDFLDWASVAKATPPKVVLMSSSLQYVENPYQVVSDVHDLRPEFVIIDRSPFREGEEDLLTVQEVPPKIYRASYPMWIFSKPKFMEAMLGGYELVTAFDSPEGRIFFDRVEARFQGFLFRAKRRK